MTSEMSWIEALAGMTITEWCNDDRLLGDWAEDSRHGWRRSG